MRFSHHLACHMTPEWRKVYLKYNDMKSLLYSKLESMPDDMDEEKRARYLKDFEETFLQFVDHELQRIDTFYQEKLAESELRFRDLKGELSIPRIGIDQHSRIDVVTEPVSEHKRYSVSRGFRESYLGLVLLQSYQDLNYTGFCKILKKYDQLFSSMKGHAYITDVLQKTKLHTEYHRLDGLIRDTEDIVTDEFENGNRANAMKKLRVPPLEKRFGPWEIYSLGICSGAFMIIFVLAAYTIAGKIDGITYDWHMFLRFYRGPCFLNFYLLCAGLNIYYWKHFGVNHVLIFELDPRYNLEAQHFFQLCGFFSCLTGFSIVLFLYAKTFNIPIFSSPLGLYALYLVFLFNPTKTFCYSGRLWLLMKVFRVITAPLHRVDFADFWLADQLASLTPVFLDIQYLICFYVNTVGVFDLQTAMSTICVTSCHCNAPTMFIRPIIRCLPEWFRFSQCCRRYFSKGSVIHIYNATKYAVTFFVVVFSTLSAISRARNPAGNPLHDPTFLTWILFACTNSIYCYLWDVRMDWGLFSSSTGVDKRFLREETVYNGKAFYYFGILEDFFLRFSWAISISLSEIGIVQGDFLVTILAPVEIFRRFIWNFFRLENEHLNNCGEYRAIRDLSVVPKRNRDDSDNSDMLTIMDFPEGMELVRVKHSKTSFTSLTSNSLERARPMAPSSQIRLIHSDH